MFAISFTVPDKLLGEVLAAVHRFKIDNLDLRPVFDKKGSKARQTGMQGWEVLARFAHSSKGPLRHKDFAPVLAEAGFSPVGISTHVKSAIKRGLMKKTAKGYIKTGDMK